MMNKGNILFFDTETTGLPSNYKAPATELDNWPRLVQIAWIIISEGEIIKEKDYIIIPNGFIIPENAYRIHGISTDIALQMGVPIEFALSQLVENVMECNGIGGHNLSYDLKIVNAELIRCNHSQLPDKPLIDTMLSTVKYCELPGKYGYKWPTLAELHQKLFGVVVKEAHHALADVETTIKCYKELVTLGIME